MFAQTWIPGYFRTWERERERGYVYIIRDYVFFSFVLQKIRKHTRKRRYGERERSESLYFSFQVGARLRERDWERREENRR